MAAQQLTIAAFRNGAVELFVIYDDVSLRLQRVGLRNDDDRLTLNVVLTDPTTGQEFFSRSRSFGTGTFTQNVQGAGIDMVIVRDTPHLPFSVQAWT